ncbi:hypothetical protein QJS04_geneDACA022823 [Acorus gramineus]|uniref:Reverse transcriptase domain-containing protein n=1 Tax=Acorus gramineus TaxID=55184 RepID=A0AAV9BQC7_ACOGR|nr:hypothetical protein QJS04_geneDACA022823 [Acorus gramineus]
MEAIDNRILRELGAGLLDDWALKPAQGYWMELELLMHYGPHTDQERELMWTELSYTKSLWDAPSAFMGDFNTTRFIADRNREGSLTPGMLHFSEWIDAEGLVDLPVTNQQFTTTAAPFRFESWWCEVEGFEEVVRSAWNVNVGALRGARRVAFKLKMLKRTLKEWSKRERIKRSEKKAGLQGRIQAIDHVEETTVILEAEREIRRAAKGELADILKLEEIEWRQKSKALWLKAGDSKTRFFHTLASQRRHMNRISKVEIDGHLWEDPTSIKENLVHHFKRAFRKRQGWKPGWSDDALPTLGHEQLVSLDAPFNEEEVKRAIFGADDFHSGQQSMGCMNSSTFVLIPKKDCAIQVDDYWPICLVNGAYMIVAKILANRLKGVCGDLVNTAQVEFIPGMLLQEGFLAAQEVVNALHRDHRKGLLFKLDFAKAYDNVDREFLLKATLKKVKYTSKPINTRCTTTRIVDFMKANNLSERPLHVQIIKETPFGVFLDIPPFRTKKCLLESILSFWNPDRERSNYACPLELVDIVEDLDNLGQYAWAKAVHIDIMKALRRSSRNLERAGGSDALDGKGYFSGCAIALNRKMEQRKQKLVSKDMEKKVKPVPSKRTLEKVEKKKVGMAEEKYASSSSKRTTSPTAAPATPGKTRAQKLAAEFANKAVMEKKGYKTRAMEKEGKRIGSIECMVKIKRRNIPVQIGKSKENQGNVANKAPRGAGATKMKKGVAVTKIAGGNVKRGAPEEDKPDDPASMEAFEVEALAQVTKEVDSIHDDILNIPTQEGKVEEEVPDKDKMVDEKVDEQSMDDEVVMKDKMDDEKMDDEFLLYDSLRKKEHTTWVGKAVKILQKTVLQETAGWPLISDIPAPQQSGGQDCGVYVCHWIACRMLDVRSYLNTKDDMAYMPAMITAAFMGDQFCNM